MKTAITGNSSKDSGIIVYKTPGTTESGDIIRQSALIILLLATEEQPMSHESILRNSLAISLCAPYFKLFECLPNEHNFTMSCLTCRLPCAET